MTDVLKFTVRGEPVGKARARAFPSIVWRDGNPEAVVRLVTPPETVSAEQRVRDEFRLRHPRHQIWTGPIMIRFTAVFQTPKSFNRDLRAAAAAGKLYCTKKPDKDNIEKLIVDALNGIAWADDAQVMGGGIKRYGSPARIDIQIQRLDDPLVPATPGQKRTERRLAATDPRQPELGLVAPQRRPRGKKHPPALQARIDAALDREGSTKPASRGLFPQGPGPRTTTSDYRKRRS